MATKALTFDDISLVPALSSARSRSGLSTKTHLGAIDLDIPIVTANMTTVTGYEMALKMHELGGAAILHRYQSPADVLRQLKTAKDTLGLELIPSIGILDTDKEIAKDYRAITRHICIDVAHGHHVGVIAMIKHLKELNFKTIIAGNVCTAKGALALAQAGADVIKVGVGPGAACTTRLVTGCGVPQFTAIQQVRQAINNSVLGVGVTIIADGGIRSSGDIVKALAAGANAVMIGSLLAGTEESPSEKVTHPDGTVWKRYAGMASEGEQNTFKGKVSNDAAEGTEFKVPYIGPVEGVIKQLVGGIRSGMSYLGADELYQLRGAEYVEISPAGFHEGTPHGKVRY